MVRTGVDNQKRLKRRKMLDRLSGGVFTAGGWVVVLAIVGMLIFMVVQVWPLWRSPKHEVSSLGAPSSTSGALTPDRRVIVGVEEQESLLYTAGMDGVIRFFDVADGEPVLSYPLEGLDEGRVTGIAAHAETDELLFATNDGRIIPVSIRFIESFAGDKRQVMPRVSEGDSILIVSGVPLRRVVHRSLQNGAVAAAISEEGRLYLATRQRARGLLAAGRMIEARIELTDDLQGHTPTAIALDPRGEMLVVGDAKGGLSYWNLRNRQNPVLVRRTSAGHSAVSALAFLTGGQSLIVGSEAGEVSQWFLTAHPDLPTGRGLTKIRSFSNHGAPVRYVAPSRRDKSFVTVDASGKWALHHATTNRTLLRGEAGQEHHVAALTPKGDGLVMASGAGEMLLFRMQYPHPEVSLRTLFGKVWYEGYDEPAYVWQSSGGSDEFEPKLSLMPLIFGTLKGSFYSLLLAVPLAIAAAVYTALFMPPAWRSVVKPILELMAGVPSVVLGFLGGLWLAPWMERNLPGVLMLLILAPLAFLVIALLWRILPRPWRQALPPGLEAFLAIPILLIVGYFSFKLGAALENGLLAGDYRQWLYDLFGLRYDQRNALVVSIAMGFAVIPVIFSIAEEAISSVPKHLLSGSLALGATMWQTARRVIVPAAAPAIFSAIMMGFGRAVGETMIVLMATGNTPLMDISPFNGFRSLAANIAVEMPEAPQGGTLYRVLFLTALLLFLLTFLVNTLAELLRQRLRKQWQ